MRIHFSLLSAMAVTTSVSGSRNLRVSPQGPRKPITAFSWASQAFAGGAGETAIGRSDNSQHKLFSTLTSTSSTPRNFAEVSPALLAKIVAVATDVDGTLSAPGPTVTTRTKDAIRAVLHSGILFFPATGKTRPGAYKMLGEDITAFLKARNVPGVFVQGLVVYGGASDDVIFEQLLSTDLVAQVVGICEERGLSLIAYSRDRIVCSRNDAQTEKIVDYLEPAPEAIGSLTQVMDAGLPVNKLIIMDTDETIKRIRPEIERLVGDGATFTEALPGMLEVLPPGASKGNGVEILLKHLGVDPTRLVALGDAENDVNMLRLAGVGVCVGNATPPAKSAANFIAPSNVEDGAAVVMERLLACKSE